MSDSRSIEIIIPIADSSIRENLIADLSIMGFDGFEELEDVLKAYIPEENISWTDLDQILNQYSLSYSKSVIEKQNWNALWESNFEPVQVGNFVAVRAGFHPAAKGVKHEIIITPKMSFGTGHHGTTYSVMQLMEAIDFQGKSVFDFGTGTGILAILAEKLGAVEVLAVDNDPWCIENASENSLINHCKCIDIQLFDTAETKKQYDIVIANINKNIILDNLALLGKAVKTGGTILLSGLLVMDESDILTACKTLGWVHQQTLEKEGWIALHLKN
jgi:ribosomal protein L11 methyltransferase